MKTTILIILICIFLPLHDVLGQTKYPYPIVGDTLPDHTFYDLINYREKTATIGDFRGKWLVLDFWAYSCSGCLKSFPKMNLLYKQFKERVGFIMVGATKARGGRKATSEMELITKNTYSRLNEAYNLEIPVAFDSVLYLKHSVGSLPQILIIDPNGIVRAKTVSIDSTKLAKLINGQAPDFEKSYSFSEARESDVYNFDLPFLTNGTSANGGTDTSFLFRSLLSVASPNTSFRMVNLQKKNFDGSPNPFVQNGKLEAFNCNLSALYRIAFFGMNFWESQDSAYGKLSQTVCWETKDSLIHNSKYPPEYTYSLIVPKSRSTPDLLMSTMQHDLYQTFGYTARIEKRLMPVYTLTVADSSKFEKLLAKGVGKLTEISKREGIISINEPFRMFAIRLGGSVSGLDYPVIDKSGLDRTVNIEIRANRFNKSEVERKLLENGLEVKLENVPMDVIVVSDRNYKIDTEL